MLQKDFKELVERLLADKELVAKVKLEKPGLSQLGLLAELLTRNSATTAATVTATTVAKARMLPNMKVRIQRQSRVREDEILGPQSTIITESQ